MPVQDNIHLLNGYKFFTSSTDADIALTLARVTDLQGQSQPGGRGLALFLLHSACPPDELKNSLKMDVELRSTNDWNGIHLIRLKDKLGTRQMPTAELLLDNCVAYQLGATGSGVRNISHMLQMTRLYNAFGSISAIRRVLSLAKCYANQRTAFGQRIRDHPLHLRTLANMEVETRSSLAFCFQLAVWLGKQDSGVASEQEQLLLRLLNPVCKLYTAKQAVAYVSEGLECFGGQGYMEDTGIARALRDCQVLPIWEGTTNILSLDVLRVLLKQPQAFTVLVDYVQASIQDTIIGQGPLLQPYVSQVQTRLTELTHVLLQRPEQLQLGAREFAYTLAHLAIFAILLQLADRTKAKPEAILLRKFCETREMFPYLVGYQQNRFDSSQIDLEEKNFVFSTEPNSSMKIE